MTVPNSLREQEDGSDSRFVQLHHSQQTHSSPFHTLSRSPRAASRRRGKNLGFTASEVSALRRHVETHIHLQISVENFSKVIGFSQWHFSRCFKVQFGCSPHRFIITQRICHARGLLISSRLTLAEIALESGFADQAHLGRSFSQHVGQSPGRWRRQHRLHAG